MATKSLGELNLKVAADASGFVQELNRADNVTRRASASIDKEVDKLTRSVKRKFSLSDVGKDFMRGLGIGSGMQVIDTLMDQVVDQFRKAAELAKSIEESIGRQVSSTLELIRLRQTDGQQLVTMEKEYARLERELADINKPRTGLKFVKRGHGESGWEESPLAATDEQRKRAHDIAAEMQALGLKIEQQKLRNAKASEEEAVKNTVLSNSLNKLKLDYEGAAEAEARGVAAVTEWNEEMDKAAERYRELVDPSKKFRDEMEEVNFLLKQGKLSAAEAAGAIEALQHAMDKDEENRVDAALRDVSGEIDAQQKTIDDSARKLERSAERMGDAFYDNFSRAIVRGQELGDVLEELLLDLLEMELRKSITGAFGGSSALGGIGNAIAGIFAGNAAGAAAGSAAAASGGFVGGFAEGGFIPPGKWGIAGEVGPEPVFGGRTGMTVQPAGGGMTVNIDARGADKAGLARVEMALRDLQRNFNAKAVSAVVNYKNRGLSAAF